MILPIISYKKEGRRLKFLEKLKKAIQISLLLQPKGYKTLLCLMHDLLLEQLYYLIVIFITI